MDTQWGDDITEKFGGLAWLKNRDTNAYNHLLFDTVRGATNYIISNSANGQVSDINMLSAFNNNGFTVGTHLEVNGLNKSNISWNFQTTHRITGVTNHGKAYECHYNPITGFTIVKYLGSGLAGHDIPHMLNKKLDIVHIKDLTFTGQHWLTTTSLTGSGYINLTNALDGIFKMDSTELVKTVSSYSDRAYSNNYNNDQYIMYGWVNSSLDTNNKLIGNYEIGMYAGSSNGVTVNTKGDILWGMFKRIDSTGAWVIFDKQRDDFTNPLFANLQDVEQNWGRYITYGRNKFTVIGTDANLNANGGQYLYMVVYDTNSNGGGSYYPKPSDTAQVQVNNAIIPLPRGIDTRGNKNSIVLANETITGMNWSVGKNYPYRTTTGYGKSIHRPRYLKSELIRTYPGEQPDYIDIEKNRVYSCDSGVNIIDNSDFSNGLTGWTIYGIGATAVVVNGRCKLSGSLDKGISKTISGLTIGKKYKLTFKYDLTLMNNKNLFFDVNYGMTLIPELSSTFANQTTLPNIGIYEFTFIASVSSGTFSVRSIGNQTPDWFIDDINIFPVEIIPVAEIPESRNYMNHIVHGDVDGSVLYIEELPKTLYLDRIITGSNRKVIYLSDYGIKAIQVNKRYVINNPFGNDNFMDCDTKLEVYHMTDGIWIELGHSAPDAGTAVNWYGGRSFSTEKGIVIQTALNVLTPNDVSGVTFSSPSSISLTSAPARITVQYNGKTGRV